MKQPLLNFNSICQRSLPKFERSALIVSLQSIIVLASLLIGLKSFVRMRMVLSKKLSKGDSDLPNSISYLDFEKSTP